MGHSSMLKITLTIVLLHTKEACATDGNATAEEMCSIYFDCSDPTTTPKFCRCDEMCSLYGDCCPNAPNLTKFDTRFFECTSIGVFMISRCPTITDEELKEMCESASSPYEISLGIPATDVASGLTYKNYYCAICNGADQNSTVLWESYFYCKGSYNLHNIHNMSELEEKVQFNNDREQWGILDDLSDENRFYPCYLHSETPTTLDMAPTIRECRPGLISNCSANWEGEKGVEEKCHGLHAPVFLQGIFAYKNIYCVMCNNESLSDIKCNLKKPHVYGGHGMGYGHVHGHGSYGGYGGGHSYSRSFRILLGLNTADNQPECKEGEVLFGNKCRELTCGFPNSVRMNGKCVPKGRKFRK